MRALSRFSRAAPQRGFTLLELAVSVAIIGVLAGVLLSRVRLYQQEAERAAVRNLVGVIRSSLSMKAVQLLASDRQNEIGKLASLNPMDLLAQKPLNYLGEYNLPQNLNISPGNWYFNRQKLLLVYISRTGATFQGSNSDRIQYRIEIIRDLDDAYGPKPAETSNRATAEGIVLNEVPELSQQKINQPNNQVARSN